MIDAMNQKTAQRIISPSPRTTESPVRQDVVRGSLWRQSFKRPGVILLTALLSLAATYSWLIFRPVEYQARFEIMAVPSRTSDQTSAEVKKETEKISRQLTDLIRTAAFQDKVYDTDFPIKRATDQKAETRRPDWRQIVRTHFNRSAGTVAVTTRLADASQATIIARASASVLAGQSQDLFGEPDVIIKVVDEVQTKRQPVWWNLMLSTLAGLIVGVLGGGVVAFLLPPSSGAKQKAPAIIRPETPPTQTLGAVSGRQALQGSPLRGGPPPGLPFDPDEDEI